MKGVKKALFLEFTLGKVTLGAHKILFSFQNS